MSDRIQEAIKDFEHFKKMGYGHCDLPSSGNIEIAISAMREKLQRETEPVPLTWEQLSERVGKPVYVRALERWEIIDHLWDDAGHITMRSGNRFKFGATRLYATEPKGEAT